MSKVNTVYCDVCRCADTNDSGFKKDCALQVVFTTDQNEGRFTEPYLSKEKIDICCDCYANLLAGNYLFGSGAQGYNKYHFKRDDIHVEKKLVRQQDER